MKRIERDNAIINYNIEGNGDITLLFVHGSYNDQTYWKEQVDYFSSRYTVVTLDLPGHGKSGKERKHWSVDGFAKDVNCVISDLQLKNVILIGHSFGGNINLIAAISEPELLLGFIGIECFKNAATPLEKNQIKPIQDGLKADFINENEKFAQKMLLTDQTPTMIRERILKDYLNAYKPMGLEIMPEIFNMAEIEKRLLPQLDLKLYLINVDYFPTNEVPLKHYAGKGYEVFHMHGTCHFPMLESPRDLNKLVDVLVMKIEKESKKAPHFTMMRQ